MSQAGVFIPSISGTAVMTLTGDIGGAVGATAGNINIISGDDITITGNPGTSTLTWSLDGTIINEITGDAGTAVPALHVLQIVGGSNIDTSCLGNSVIIELGDDVVINGSFQSGGDITSINGDCILNTGSFVAAAGGIIVETGMVTNFGGILANSGNIQAAGGNVIANGNLIGTGGLTVSAFTEGVAFVSSAGVFSSSAGTDGQVIIGATGSDPDWASITSSGGTITITAGANTLNLETGGAIATTFATDSGNAVPAAGNLTVAGGANINTAGAGSTVTVNLDTAVSGLSSLDMAAGGRIGTATSAGNTLLLQAYDVDGAAYTTFATLTANNDPTMDLDTAVTINSSYIYRAGGTDVPVSDGGTGVSTLTDHGVLVGSGATAITALAVGTDGQVLVGSTGADPVFATLTSSGGTITFTPGAGSLNLEAVPAGGGVTWNEVTGTSQAMAVNNGYILNNAALVTATLPATAALGSIIRIAGKGAGGWTIAQNAGQTIHFGNTDTTTGVGGSLASTNTYDSVELVCITTNTDFSVLSSIGNITIV